MGQRRIDLDGVLVYIVKVLKYKRTRERGIKKPLPRPLPTEKRKGSDETLQASLWEKKRSQTQQRESKNSHTTEFITGRTGDGVTSPEAKIKATAS